MTTNPSDVPSSEETPEQKLETARALKTLINDPIMGLIDPDGLGSILVESRIRELKFESQSKKVFGEENN
jgi:hypothetical protein